MGWRMFRRIIGTLVACSLPGALSMAQGDRVQKSFPKHAEVEFEHSIITIPIILHGETEPAEVLKLDAYMKLDREPPVRNGLGYSQFEFTIDAWELHGYSKVLDAYITFKLSDTVKPKSLGVALQKNKDFPAMIVYNAIYDIYLDDVRVAENRAGVAFATGVMEIPPRNITVAFNKPFAFEHPRNDRSGDGRSPREKGAGGAKWHCPFSPDAPCECNEAWCMGPGSCEDMESINQEQFEAGVAKAKSYRTQGQARGGKRGAASPGASSTPRKKPD